MHSFASPERNPRSPVLEREFTSPRVDAPRYLLIGGGVAAATLSRELLARDPSTSILILEAGPEVPARDRRFWWDYVVQKKQPYDFCYDLPGENDTVGDIKWGFDGARVMAYGGSTIHWGGWSLRFKPEDFHLFTNTGEGADWPFGYEELQDDYFAAEKFLSVCGDDRDQWTPRPHQPYPMPPFEYTAADGVMMRGFEACDIKPGRMPIARYKKCMTTGTCKYCPFGSRFNAQYVLDELRSDPRHSQFEIRNHTLVRRLLAQDGKRSQILGAEVQDRRTGRIYRIEAPTVVLCAGTYESAKLLLSSTDSQWERGIGNDHDLVGRHIVSHSFLRVLGSTPSNPERWVQEYDFPTLMSRTYDSPQYQKEGKVFLFKNRVLPNTDIAALMIQGKRRSEIDRILSGPMQMELQAFYEEKGQFNNRLVLKAGTNRLGLPLMTVQFKRHPRFAIRARRHLDRMERVFAAMGYSVKPEDSKWDDPGGHHATGTCRMGRTPEQGVTDGTMKVFGTQNLYVCSNAAFPTCSAVNPTLTLTALAIRLARHLAPAQANAKTPAAPPAGPTALKRRRKP